MGTNRSRGLTVACIALAGAVLPASAAGAAADYFLKLDGVKGESKDDKHKGEIEISSFSWGTTRHADGSYDALTDGLLIVRHNSDPPPSGAAGGGGGGAAGSGAGKVNMQDMSVMRGPRQTTSLDGPQVAAGDVDGDGRADTAAAGKFGAVSGAHRDDSLSGARSVKPPRDSASGLATGKRTHKPLKLIKPLETGSMTMHMKLAGCAVGTRYPSAELTTPGGRYALADVVVASCGGGAPTEQVTLNYAKVKVRAWDPQKKEH